MSRLNWSICIVFALVTICVGTWGDAYLLDLVAIAMLFGLFAASVDFSWGYCGVLNLGSGLYFGIGCYANAYCLKHDLGASTGTALGFLVSASTALAIGIAGLKPKATNVQFGLIGLVLSLAARQISIGLYDLLGGSNGITNVQRPVFRYQTYTISFQNPVDYFWMVSVIVAIIVSGMRWVVHSHFGRILICVRDAPEKAESLGYDIYHTKLWATTITACVSSIAGALYAPLSGIAHPGLFGIIPNMLVLVWVAIGGQGSLLGPFLCAVILKLVESELGSNLENIYVLVMGVTFVVTVVFWPRGVFAKTRGTSARTSPND